MERGKKEEYAVLLSKQPALLSCPMSKRRKACKAVLEEEERKSIKS